MASVLSRIHQNLVYIPSAFLEKTGLSETMNVIIGLNEENNKIILTPISEKLAKKARVRLNEFDSEITRMRRNLKDLYLVDKLNQEKEDYIKNIHESDLEK